MSQNKQYFFLKIGNGNRLLEPCLKSDIGGAWIGYADLEIPEVDSNGYIVPSDNKRNRDLDFLASISSEANRERVRLISFTPSELIYWEITNRLRKIEKNDVDKICKAIDKLALSKEYFKSLDRWKEYVAGDIKEGKDYLGAKVLPIKKIGRVSRSKLLPQINSLAVYQYLNRGTCRPLAAMKSDANELIKWIDPSESLLDRLYYQKQNWTQKETHFSYFVRRALDFIFDRYVSRKEENNKEVVLKSYLNIVPGANTYDVVFSTLNPSQVETAAVMIALDLGFSIDIGIAKALDYIDIRAKIPKNRTLTQQVEGLKSICRPSSSLLEKIKTDRVLDIQCKAYDYKPKAEELKEIVLLKPFGEAEENMIILDKVNEMLRGLREGKKKEKFPHFCDWLSLLTEYIEA